MHTFIINITIRPECISIFEKSMEKLCEVAKKNGCNSFQICRPKDSSNTEYVFISQWKNEQEMATFSSDPQAIQINEENKKADIFLTPPTVNEYSVIIKS